MRLISQISANARASRVALVRFVESALAPCHRPDPRKPHNFIFCAAAFGRRCDGGHGGAWPGWAARRNQPTNQQIDRPTDDQPINRSTDQPINRSTDRNFPAFEASDRFDMLSEWQKIERGERGETQLAA
jgi:hypothetical protein